MRIGEIIVDWLNETVLFEMAYQRKKVIEIISNHQQQIAIHLVKCLYYDVPSGMVDHWIAEINAWLGKINSLKLKNGKKLSGDVYYALLFREPLGELSDLEGIVDSIDTFEGMGSYNKVGSIHIVHERCEKILHSLSYDLANGKARNIQHYFEAYP